ncbi:MAG: ABC transporter permease [Vampirovibrionales bacterium]|nr:ABC transporter permease [Vampirovibrionales bacterium]
MSHPLIRAITAVGELSLMAGETIQQPFCARFRLNETFRQIGLIGVDSLPMALIICMIAGSVLSLQAAIKMADNGAQAYVGAGIALSIVREIAPLFSALAVTARCATSTASQLGHLAVSQQLDALRICKVSLQRYLIAPRVWAFILSLPLLTILAEVVGILGGMVISRVMAGVTTGQFLDSVWLNLKPSDLMASVVKALVFGLMIGTIACWSGLHCAGGAREVGRASTQAAVIGSMSLIVMNFILTWLLFL